MFLADVPVNMALKEQHQIMFIAITVPDLSTTSSTVFLNSPTLIYSTDLHTDFGIKIKEKYQWQDRQKKNIKAKGKSVGH